MERHDVVEPALWRYGAVELAWLENTVQFAPTQASEQHVTMVLADGGTVAMAVAEPDATSCVSISASTHRGNERLQFAVHNNSPGTSLLGSSTLHNLHSDEYYPGNAPTGLLQTPLVGQGQRTTSQFEERKALLSGTAWLWSRNVTLTVTPHAPGRALIARLPVEALIARLGSIAKLDGRPLSFEQGSGAICFTLLVALIAQAPLLSRGQRQTLGDSAFDTIVVWLRSEQTARTHLSTHRRELLNAICGYIERYLDDDQLCPRTIANSFGISVRYLHTLFAVTGTTIAQWIMIRRLETICSELLLRSDDRGCIREVALRWGFHDLSHFSRVFRRYFGLPPLTYIRQRTRGPCTEP